MIWLSNQMSQEEKGRPHKGDQIMNSLQTRVFASLVALLLIVAATPSFAPVADAQRGGGSRMGGSSFRSSSSWSSGPSKSVWGSRSGGGIYTKPSSPSSPSSVKPSDAYGKPSLQPGASSPYSKPSLGGGARARTPSHLLWPESSLPTATPNLKPGRPIQPLHRLSKADRSSTGKWCSR